MSNMDTHTENSPARVEWTGSWEEFPERSYSEKQLSREWWHHPEHKRVREDKGVTALEAALARQQWGEDGDSTMALRSAVYKFGDRTPRKDYAPIIAKAFSDPKFPLSARDLWGEQWMVGKFLYSAMGDDPGSKQLFSTIANHWPDLLVICGRSHGGEELFKHPLRGLVKQHRIELAAELMDKIPASDWLSTGEDHYERRRLWRERDFWFNDDPTWILAVANHYPHLMSVDPKKGIGPIEQAAKDHLPRILKALIEHGLKADPEKNFGMELIHWACFGVSEKKWVGGGNGGHVSKSRDEIQTNIEGYRKTLETMVELGLDISLPVAKVVTKGMRRAQNMPKPGMTATDYLNSQGFSQESAIALEQINLMVNTAQAPKSTRRAARL